MSDNLSDNKEKRASFKKNIDSPVLPKNQFGQTILSKNKQPEEYVDISNIDFDIQNGVQANAGLSSVADKVAKKLIANNNLTESQKQELEEYLKEMGDTDKEAVEETVDIKNTQKEQEDTQDDEVSGQASSQCDKNILTKTKTTTSSIRRTNNTIFTFFDIKLGLAILMLLFFIPLFHKTIIILSFK